jgi:hypothetical protein
MPDSILRWEILTEESVNKEGVVKLTGRLSVPGGWLYRYERIGPTTNSRAVSIAFAPEPRNAG